MVSGQCVMVDFRAVEKRFGRNAALIEADPAKRSFLEQDNFESGGAGSFRGHIATGATADDR